MLKNKLIDLRSKFKSFYRNFSSELKTFLVILAGCLIAITLLNRYFITTQLSLRNEVLVSLVNVPVILNIENDLSGLNIVTFKDTSSGKILSYKILCPSLIIKPNQVVNVNVGQFKNQEEQLYFTVLGPDQFCTKY